MQCIDTAQILTASQKKQYRSLFTQNRPIYGGANLHICSPVAIQSHFKSFPPQTFSFPTGLIPRTPGPYNDFTLLNGWICLHGVLD